MAPKKKVVKEEEVTEKEIDAAVEELAKKVDKAVVVPMLPPDLSVDYPSEGLNNMARTINEILAVLRYGQK